MIKKISILCQFFFSFTCFPIGVQLGLVMLTSIKFSLAHPGPNLMSFRDR